MGQKTVHPNGRLGILGILIFITAVQTLILFIVEPDVRTRFALIEILVFVVNPLIVFYLHNNWPHKIVIINMVILVVVWFVTLPLFHELSHLIGVFLIGSKPTAYQLIPKFWEGDFTTAYVGSKPVIDWRAPIPGLSPYIKDILMLIIGFVFLKGKKVRNGIGAGFLYTFFCLGSTFDIVNNYSQKLLGYLPGNDFYGVTLGWGDAWSNIIGITFSSFAICICVWVLMAYKSPNSVRKFKLLGESRFKRNSSAVIWRRRLSLIPSGDFTGFPTALAFNNGVSLSNQFSGINNAPP